MNSSQQKIILTNKKNKLGFTPVKKYVSVSIKNISKCKQKQMQKQQNFYQNQADIEVNPILFTTPKKDSKLSLNTTILKTKKISKVYKSNNSIKQINEKTVKGVDKIKKQKENIFLEQEFNELRDEEQILKNIQSSTLLKKPNKKVQQTKIFYNQEFHLVNQIDFQLLFRLNTTKKIFSTLLLSQNGQVIFVDQLGSQLFEGSLNNLQRNPIQSIIVQSVLPKFLQKAKKISKSQSQVVKLVIYSKNSKRRYSKKVSKTDFLSHQEIFNRYLKSISATIKPIQISFKQFQKYQGEWNKNLVKNNFPLKCYLVRARLSKNLPNLHQFDFQNDKKINKFIQYTNKKQGKIVNQSARQEQGDLSKNQIPYQKKKEPKLQSSFDHINESYDQQLAQGQQIQITNITTQYVPSSNNNFKK